MEGEATRSGCQNDREVIMLSFKEYKDNINEAVHYHVENNIPLAHNIYRLHSEEFYKLFREARTLYNEGVLDVT